MEAGALHWGVKIGATGWGIVSDVMVELVLLVSHSTGARGQLVEPADWVCSAVGWWTSALCCHRRPGAGSIGGFGQGLD